MWNEAINDWTAWLIAAARPQSTIRLRRYQLHRFAEDNTDPWRQTQKTLIAWLSSHSWAPESRRSYRSALRSFYGWAYASGLIDHDPAALLPPIRPVRHLPRPTPESIVRVALSVADERSALIVALAAMQGMRRGEIAVVHSDDLTEDLAGYSLRVHGKGDKIRIIPLHNEVARLLRARPTGWAFPGEIGGHLSPRWVGTLAKRALQAQWTTHTLRHRFATTTYAGSRDLLAVQGLLGHSKPETTLNYVQLPDDAMRSALRWAA